MLYTESRKRTLSGRWRGIPALLSPFELTAPRLNAATGQNRCAVMVCAAHWRLIFINIYSGDGVYRLHCMALSGNHRIKGELDQQPSTGICNRHNELKYRQQRRRQAASTEHLLDDPSAGLFDGRRLTAQREVVM